MKYSTLILITLITITGIIFTQSVDIKDSELNSLITITDEGTAGSITIPEVLSVVSSTNKLFNYGGDLYWETTQLSTVGSSDDRWTISGNHIFSTLTGNVGIGTTTPLSKLSIGGAGAENILLFIESYDVNSKGIYVGASEYGGLFQSFGGGGIGVKGEGGSGGVKGSASGITGRGVYGYAEHNSGVNYGVRGKTESSNGYAGYFEGRGYFSGNVGIGTTTPSSTLQVNGTTKIGNDANVLSITDIIEITGTLPSTGSGLNVSYPSGFTNTNTRVLSCEIAASSGGNGWWTLGYYNSTHFSRVNIVPPHITIIFPDESEYHDAQFRLVLMKVS